MLQELVTNHGQAENSSSWSNIETKNTCNMAVGQSQWYHFGVGAPLILEPILVGSRMFTGD